MMRWNVSVAIGTLLCTFASVAVAVDSAPTPLPSALTTKRFVVFDGTLYRNKPDFSRYGIRPVTILGGQLWDRGKPEETLPRKDRVHRFANETADSGKIVILDIEHWPLQGSATAVQENLTKYLTVLRWFREAAPQVEVGYYGTVPIRDYWRSLKDPTRPEHMAWSTENARLRPLALAVDALFPSLYTFYDDHDGWRKFAIAQIAEARRYGGGKPVYVFLWPKFHDSNRWLKDTYLPADFWKLELETAREHADGVVIWGGWGNDNRPAEWDGHALWWQVTKEFLVHLSRNEGSTRGRPLDP